MNNMASKKIMINPTFLKVDKERKKTPKQHSPNLVSLESNNVKKKLIGKIKNFQANQQKNNEQSSQNKPEILTTDFNSHLSQLENIIKKKKDKKKRKQTKKYKLRQQQMQQQQQQSLPNPLEQQHVSLIPPTAPQSLVPPHQRLENSKPNTIEPAYGCLKNGSKPTWSQYKKTLKKTEQIKKDKINFVEPPKIQIPTDVKERQNKLAALKQNIATPPVAKDPVQKLINCKRTLKKYKLGKNKKSLTVGVLIKSGKTRKMVRDERKILQSRCLSEVKQYLRKHNLIRIGTNAPENVLRKIYEDSFLAGNIYNKNPENLLHNYLNNEDGANLFNE